MDELTFPVICEKYGYQVYNYNVGHYELTIRVSHEHDYSVFYILFTGVLYFSGRLVGNGAKFQIASNTKCVELTRKIGSVAQLDDETIVEYFKLYYVETGFQNIEVIAAGAYVFVDNSL
jgi:hypothetical protein